jgi:phosphocarrier protein
MASSSTRPESGTAVEREIEVVNRLGLHARASAKLVKLLGRYQARAWLSFGGRSINARSIMGLMMLAAGRGSMLRLRTEGADAEAAADAVAALFAARFDEGE